MSTDRFGTDHSSSSPEAIAFFETAVHGLAAHRPSTGEALGRALAADPGLVAGHALKGLANVILAREETLPVAAQAHADALACLDVRGGSDDERTLVAALGEAREGRFFAAADRLEAALVAAPHVFLFAKAAHALRFMLGDAKGMLAATSATLKHWSEDRPGFGFLLGCHAFALEERGAFAMAEVAGRRASALEPEDAWGQHAVSHVHEMTGRTAEGIAWLESTRPAWSRCNNFSFHMAWHLALFHLERADHEAVLRLYDEEVRPAATDDFRDVANAVSLLWRLEQEGVAVGERWDELAVLARRRRHDLTLTFASLHHLLTLVAIKDRRGAQDLAAAIAARAETGEGDQAGVMALIGRDLAALLVGLHGARAPLERLARDLPAIGGSHAQRDVFVRTLAAIAAERGDRTALEGVLAVRHRLRREDRFARDVLLRLEAVEARRAPRRGPLFRRTMQPWNRPAASSLPL